MSEEKRITNRLLSFHLEVTRFWPEPVTWPYLTPGGQGSTFLPRAQKEKQKYLVDGRDDCHSFLNLPGQTYSLLGTNLSVGWEVGQEGA